MDCYLCGKKIGWVRRIVDQQYCSTEHRREASLASARALRDIEDVMDEPWSVHQATRKAKQQKTSQAASMVAVCFVAVLLVIAVSLPNPAVTTYPAGEDASLSKGGGLIQRAAGSLGSALGSAAPSSIRHDFSSGLNEWSTATVRNASAARASGDLALPGSSTLRIWNKSTSLSNYSFDFMSPLDKKSLAFAFRATDPRNYYATRITITKPGPLPNAGLIRYVMLDGREWDRVQLPLPLTLERGREYRVRVSVQDDRFITWVNGQVVSTWSDKRLARGGVGFFSDTNDASSVRWVALSERDTLIGKMLAHFSLITLPTLP